MRSLIAGCGVLVGCALFAEQALGQQEPVQQVPGQQAPAQKALAHQAAPKNEFWEARVKQVRVGMTRQEVERLLPPYSPGKGETWNYVYTGRSTVGSGGSQGNSYFVAPGWRVGACYDYTGIPRDADGTALPGSREHPQNRLLGPVSLTWHLFERKPTLVDPD